MAASRVSRIAWPSLPRVDGVAERGREAGQDRRVEQELAHRLRLAGEHLVGEVVEDEAVAAGELRDEPLDVPPPGEREGGHLEAHGPPLGALLQGLDVGGRERQAHRLVQEVGGLLGGEAEIAGAQLGELAAGAQPREVERRIHPRGDHQVQARRQPVEQELQGPVDRRAVDGVVVVEHQHEIVRPRRRSRSAARSGSAPAPRGSGLCACRSTVRASSPRPGWSFRSAVSA